MFVCDQPSNDKEEAQTQFSNFLTSQAKPLHSEIVKEMLRYALAQRIIFSQGFFSLWVKGLNGNVSEATVTESVC